MQIADECAHFCAKKKKTKSPLHSETWTERYLSYVCFSTVFPAAVDSEIKVCRHFSTASQCASVCLCVWNISCYIPIIIIITMLCGSILMRSSFHWLFSLIENLIGCCLSHCQRNLLFTMSLLLIFFSNEFYWICNNVAAEWKNSFENASYTYKCAIGRYPVYIYFFISSCIAVFLILFILFIIIASVCRHLSSFHEKCSMNEIVYIDYRF